MDSAGFITKDTLISFQGQLHNTSFAANMANFAVPGSFFSFNTTLPIDSGSLAIYSPSSLCIGAPAAFGLCGLRSGYNLFGGVGLGPQFFTTQAPVVTLVSSTTPDHPTPEDPTSGVPEPATWAMMILGFGALGVALRQRRKLVSICG